MCYLWWFSCCHLCTGSLLHPSNCIFIGYIHSLHSHSCCNMCSSCSTLHDGGRCNTHLCSPRIRSYHIGIVSMGVTIVQIVESLNYGIRIRHYWLRCWYSNHSCCPHRCRSLYQIIFCGGSILLHDDIVEALPCSLCWLYLCGFLWPLDVVLLWYSVAVVWCM